MNDTSRAAVRVCEAINNNYAEASGKEVPICAYTFDAGPNAVIYYLADHETEVAGLFKAMLKGKEGWESRRGAAVNANHVVLEGTETVAELLQKGVSRVILTSVGDGPRRVEEHLC